MKIKALSAAFALLAASGPAFAQQPEQVIAFLDKDGDGMVNLNEYLTFQAGRMAQFDANGDGVLSLAEFKDSLQGQAKMNAQRSFDAFNNEDDRRNLTRREFLGYHAFIFNTYIDTNRDGFMSAAEWAKIMKAQ